jgi:hypothetical protein
MTAAERVAGALDAALALGLPVFPSIARPARRHQVVGARRAAPDPVQAGRRAVR